MTKDMETAEAAAFASAFVDKVCFQASQVPVPSGRASESEALLWQRKIKLSHSYANRTNTCPGHWVGCTRGREGAGQYRYSNCSLSPLEGCSNWEIPNDWKEANGTPILPREGQGGEDQGNCRLISLRAVFGNLME